MQAYRKKEDPATALSLTMSKNGLKLKNFINDDNTKGYTQVTLTTEGEGEVLIIAIELV